MPLVRSTRGTSGTEVMSTRSFSAGWTHRSLIGTMRRRQQLTSALIAV